MKVVLFTGAGASVPLGYPMTNEFFAESNFSSGTVRVLDNAKAYLKKTVLDVEEILSLLDPIGELYGTASGKFLRQHVGAPYNSLKQVINEIQRHCFKVYGRPPNMSKVKGLYLPIFNAVQWENNGLTLITTNYDPVSDKILLIAKDSKIQYSDGFDNLNLWAPEVLDYLDKDENKYSGLSVYRLHGSLSWLKEEGEIKNTRTYGMMNGTIDDHSLIYPGYKGDPKNHVEEIYRYCHENFEQKLAECDLVIVIGFAFRDDYINKAIFTSYQANKKMRLLIVNPERPTELKNFVSNEVNPSKKSRKRYKHIMGRFGDEDVVTEIAKYIKNEVPKGPGILSM